MVKALPAVAAFLFAAGAMSAAPSKDFRRTVPLTANGRVELHSERGTAHITSWDRREVEVAAHIEARPTAHDPEESIRHTEVKLDATSDEVRIQTDFGERFWSGRWMDGDQDAAPLVHYEIKVPRNVDLTVDDNRSEIEIGDISGHLRLHTDRSSIRVASLSGAISVEADRGSVDIQKLDLTGPGEFHTDRTEVDLGISHNHGLNLDLDLDRISPSVDDNLLSGVIHDDRRHVTYHGSVGSGGPKLQYSGDRGSLRLRRM